MPPPGQVVQGQQQGLCACGDHTYLQALLLPGRHRASVVGKVTVQLSFFLYTLLTDMKNDATDRFMRNTIRFCNCSERFFLLHNTMQHGRPL